MNTSVLTKDEIHQLCRAAWYIWEQIGVDVAGSVREAESYAPEEIVEVAFDAGRLWEHDQTLDVLWRTWIDIVGYDTARKTLAHNLF